MMGYSPPPILANHVTMPHISFWQMMNVRVSGGTGTPGSAALAANRAYYLPIHLAAPTIAKRMWIAVGGTGGTNSCSIGIYDAVGNLIVKTADTTVGTANQVQHIDITDTLLGPGAYFLAYSQNGTTALVYRLLATTADAGRIIGVYQEDTAYPLPTTATFATGGQIIPIFGIATTASP